MNNDPFDDSPQPQTPPENDFFSGGSPSCKFTTIGDSHRGTIAAFEVGQQRDIKTGEPKFWPDGKKAEVLVITLQTDERDAEIDDDDGERRLYVNKPGGMFAAIKTAMGKEKLVVGARLAVKYVKNGKPTSPGFNPPKEYIARYAPPGAVPQQQQSSSPTQSSAPANGDNPIALSKSQALAAFNAAREGMSQAEKRSAWSQLLGLTIPDKAVADYTASDWQRIRRAATPVEEPFSDADDSLAAISDALNL